MEEWSYLGLFVFSFLSATIVPFSSEAVFSGMLLGNFNPVYCLVLAGTGNTLGGMFNYLLGYKGNWTWIEKVLRMKHDKVMKYDGFVQKYGMYLALFCWLPFVGDIFGLLLGMSRVKWFPVLILMTIGKFLRYVVLAFLLM